MAEIHPFRGVHYNQRLVKDLAGVICPPYDIISPQLQQELYQRHQYNFVRLEHNRELPQDTTKDNKYTRSAAVLERWLAQKVLVADKTSAIYLHDHYFQHGGKEYRRRGIAPASLTEKGTMSGLSPSLRLSISYAPVYPNSRFISPTAITATRALLPTSGRDAPPLHRCQGMRRLTS